MKNYPKAKYIGELPLGGVNVQCAVIEDGDNAIRMLSETGVTKILGSRSGGSKQAKLESLKVGALTPVFLASNNLKPYINQEDRVGALKPLKYLVGNTEFIGYQAEVIPIVCEILLRARDAGALQKRQLPRAKKAEILIRSFAKVGINALVDEATGYQHDRKYNALRLLVNAYIEKELQPWTKTFPDSFFASLDKLYKKEKTTPRNRPRYYGKFIVKYVYDPLENGFVKRELDKKNILPNGKRKARFFQWLTKQGKTQLLLQIGKIEGLIQVNSNKRRFHENFQRLTQVSIFDYIDDTD